MRALCGAIITAGSLIGLGLAGLGIGTRYSNFLPRNSAGEIHDYVKFWQVDNGLIIVLVLLTGSLICGFGIAILGLAYHHERRHHERLHLERRNNSEAPRVSVG
jgi:hypothetical protein